MKLIRSDLCGALIVELPGVTSSLHDGSSNATLIRELGDNYGRHHGYLGNALHQRGRPQPADFDTLDAFIDAWTEVEAIIETEVLLRRCEAARKRGRRLNAPLNLQVPLVDSNDELVSLDEYRVD